MALVDLAQAVALCLAAAVVFMTAVFFAARAKGRFDAVDMAWGLVFIVITGTAFMRGPQNELQVLVSGMVFVWGIRLSRHIYERLRRTTTEDRRYVELRSKWHTRHPIRAIYWRIYLTQALLAVLVTTPVIIVNTSHAKIITPLAWVGYALWVIGMLIEANADAQLRRFIQDPQNKGKLMTRGLWSLSRHPNYFGEITLWWGIGLICLTVPSGWIGLVGPLTITSLILFVSGIPPTERASANRPGWETYKRRTSVLIPWFPRKGTA